MKLAFAFSLITLLASQVFARNVECFGRTNEGDRVQVSLTGASQMKIGSPSVLVDDKMLAYISGDVNADAQYRPTPRYAGLQRFELRSNPLRVYLLLPLVKSGNFTGFLQIRSSGGEADTVRLRCEQI